MAEQCSCALFTDTANASPFRSREALKHARLRYGLCTRLAINLESLAVIRRRRVGTCQPEGVWKAQYASAYGTVPKVEHALPCCRTTFRANGYSSHTEPAESTHWQLNLNTFKQPIDLLDLKSSGHVVS
jgi:hypothetical protein